MFSTDPDFKFDHGLQDVETIAPEKQRLSVRLDTKQRAGKSVSLVEGFIGKADDLESLGRALKGFCGTGGSIKDGLIIVQGDQRDKLYHWLLKNGYSKTRKF